MLDLSSKDWLARLVDAELERYDPDAARARLPAEVRDRAAAPDDLAPASRVLVARSLRPHRAGAADDGAREAFLASVRGHVGLVLDLALLAGAPPDAARRRCEVAAFLAGAAGADAIAVACDPARPGGPARRAVQRAFRAAGRALFDRFYPPGDPKLGLPLYPGALAVMRRRLARVAMGAHRSGKLDPRALGRHRAYAEREAVLLAEAVASLAAAVAPGDSRARALRLHQLSRLGLPRAAWREARRGVGSPRSAAEIAAAAPETVRPFLLEQILLAPLRAGWPAGEAARFAEAFAGGGGLGPAELAAAQVEAAAQHGDLFQWFDALEPEEWQALAEEWEVAADDMVERLSTAVTDNLGAIATEIRETGELGGLLAKAAAGRSLSSAEKRKVKALLIDLAKAVPALAIFAAPGGMLLLPLLAKLLPFNLLPSAWKKPPAVAVAVAVPAPAPAKARAGGDGAK